MRREAYLESLNRSRKLKVLKLLSLVAVALIVTKAATPNVSQVSATSPRNNESVQNVQVVPQTPIAPFKPSTELKVELNFNNATYAQKKRAIIERLKYNHVSDKNIDTFLSIFELESCRNRKDKGCFATDKVPKTAVYHCRRPDGSSVAVEIIDRNGVKVQAYCSDYGYKTTYKEQSVGMAQILVSTWKLYNCKGNIYDYDYKEQVDCAVKIYKTSGFYPWSTYKLLNK